MSYNVTTTRKHLLVTLLGCQIVSFIIALCPLIGFGSYGLEAHGTSCGLAWEDTSAASQGYLVLITVVCFALPLAIIVVCYSLIFRTVWKTNKGVGPMADSTSVYRKKKQLQLIKLSVALVVVYVICWTPYAIVSFNITFGQPEEINPMMPRFAAWFAKTEAVLNPIVYVLMSKSFRHNIEHVVCCMDTAVAPTRNLTTFATHGQRIQSEVCDSQVPVTVGISSRE
ncbi:rhodopsin-like [Mya arenaria]|uniref:rhodopsin-like n=1 Tax=Mya arenaria TaxID=6604 RepID=UPI0022E77D2C|nr:rhodopsin-like [Mya arenaria]